MVLWKNYGYMKKTMVQYRKLLNFEVLWKKDYGIMEKKTMVL